MYDIIISGVTGFVGANYMRYFSNHGLKVLGLGRSANPPAEILKYGDYKSIDLTKTIPKLSAKTIIHCAGLASDKLPLEELMETNFGVTKRLFKAVEVDHFIQISSASVYPPDIRKHIESDDIQVIFLSNYGLSKLIADEFLISQANLGTKITILRPRAIYGIGDRVLLPWILQLQRFNSMIFPGKLAYEISLTNINNLLLLTSKVVADTTYDFEIFNVCDTNTYRLDKIITQLVNRVVNKKLVKITIPESLVYQLGRLFPKSNLNPNALNFFLCNHQISNQKALDYFNIEFQYNFYNCLPELATWVNRVGKERIAKQKALLPWMA